MRAALRDATKIPTSVGRVHLRMSVGVHSGTLHLFRVGRRHHELVIAGEGADLTARMEALAGPGQVVVSSGTKHRLPNTATREMEQRWLAPEMAETSSGYRRGSRPTASQQRGHCHEHAQRCFVQS